jgi:hypothetical protein
LENSIHKNRPKKHIIREYATNIAQQAGKVKYFYLEETSFFYVITREFELFAALLPPF